MPVYEYRCEACGATFAVLFWPPDRPVPRCTRCGSLQARRLISRVSVLQGEEARLERLAEGAAGLDESDPTSLARWAREVGRELGEDVSETFEQALEESSSEASDAELDRGGPGT